MFFPRLFLLRYHYNVYYFIFIANVFSLKIKPIPNARYIIQHECVMINRWTFLSRMECTRVYSVFRIGDSLTGAHSFR